MNKTVLQVPVSKTLRLEAEKAAIDYGFSSLQEIIRIFMTKLSKKAIDISFQETFKLSPGAEIRYNKIDKDFISGKNIYFAKSTKELRAQLSE